MKELEAKWLVSAFDYFQSTPSIIRNGFMKPGIVDAIEGQQASTSTGAITSEDDPFADIECQHL